MKKISLVIMILALALVAVLYIVFKKNNPDNAGVACTLEAKLCPDGSYVGRSGPNCEFTECPEISEGKIAKINQKILNNEIFITPQSVVEDSRCPVDVTCIQAGTVRIEATLKTSLNSESKTLVLGQEISFAGKTITLVSVRPAPHSKQTISTSDYDFEFSVK